MSALTPGQRIRQWRRIKGWTQKDLAKAVGIWPSKLHRLENEQQDPKAIEVERIAHVLGLSLPQFYGSFEVEPSAAGGRG